MCAFIWSAEEEGGGAADCDIRGAGAPRVSPPPGRGRFVGLERTRRLCVTLARGHRTQAARHAELALALRSAGHGGCAALYRSLARLHLECAAGLHRAAATAGVAARMEAVGPRRGVALFSAAVPTVPGPTPSGTDAHCPKGAPR
jgi:hypothetical protein